MLKAHKVRRRELKELLVLKVRQGDKVLKVIKEVKVLRGVLVIKEPQVLKVDKELKVL